MCGIVGLSQHQNIHGRNELDVLVERMAETVMHRGPDGSGVWVDEHARCAFGHRRLSIIDTSNGGAQPLSSGDGRWWVTFNGEIYNFLDIRAQLERKGRVFRSRSDTEVLVEALAEWGASAVQKFDGMFAFAAFDTRAGELILARDPFGEKPLYYTTLDDGTFAFASELRSLEILPGFSRKISIDAVAEYLTFQYVGAPRTIYENVAKLPPAHIMTKAGRATETRRYYQFDPGVDIIEDRSVSDLADELEDILIQSLRRRLISDVPLGAFLSGGVDSSLVCALATQRLGVHLNTYSMGFHNAPESEHLVAREFARHLGAVHHEEIVSPDVDGFLDMAGAVLDEPNADTSCLPTYLLSRFARQDVTVAISGDGGDEMFGGYGRYLSALLSRDVRQVGELPFWTPGKSYYGPSILIASETDVQALLGFLPTGFRSHLLALRSDIDSAHGQLLAALRRSDVDNYLPGAVLAKVDRMSMQNSLEVRTPFLNVELASFAGKLPESMCAGRGSSKRILRELACRYLPRHLVNLPKQGFGLPMADWARQSLLPKARAMLGDDSCLRASLGSRPIDNLLDKHAAVGGFNAYQLWSVVVLEAWLRERDVDFPILAPAREDVSRSKSAAHSERVLWALPATGTLLLVMSCEPGVTPRLNVEDLDHTLYAKLIELQLTHHGRSRLNSPTVLPWTGNASPEARRVFEDATLFFLDSNAATWLGASECERLRSLRVKRIVTLHRTLRQEFEDFEFRYKSPFHNGVDLARLWPYRVATLTTSTLMKLAGLSLLGRAGENLFVSAPIEQIPFEPDVELTEHYAVFEGDRQCPPVRMGHDEIEPLGDGRYCVFGQRVAVSASRRTAGQNRLFWVVPINGMTAPYLQICPSRMAAQNAPSRYKDFFAHFIENTPVTKSTRPLAPGDRVVVLTHGLSPGGAERQWVYLAKALQRKGFEVTFVVQNPLNGANGHYLPALRSAGIELLLSCDLPFSMEAARLSAQFPFGFSGFSEANKLAQTVNALRLISPRVVFAQLDEPNILAAMAGLICGVDRIVMSFRNYNPSNFDYFHQHWFQAAYRALVTSPKIVLTGNFAGANADYANWIGIREKPIITIPNALDTELFPHATEEEIQRTREELGLEEDTPVILGVFRLSHEKRPVDFMTVALRIAEEHKSAHVVIAGVGPLEKDIRHLLSDSAISKRVHILGRREDIATLMAASSILLHTAAKEGMPNAIMEAMLIGLPVVATDAGATKELVAHGETGFIHEIGDCNGLTKSCRQLLADPDLARRMGRAARARVNDQFAPDVMASRYLDATGVYKARGIEVRAKEPAH